MLVRVGLVVLVAALVGRNLTIRKASRPVPFVRCTVRGVGVEFDGFSGKL